MFRLAQPKKEEVMKKRYLSVLTAILMLVGIPGMAQSDLVTYTFIGTIVDGPRTGETGTGSFTYDDDLIINGDEIINPKEDGLLVSFTFDGQYFNETNDALYDESPELGFDNSEPTFLDYYIADGVNGVNFNDPNIAGLWFYTDPGLIPLSSGDFNFKTEISAVPVPIPGALWLLGSGMIGLAGLRRRKSYKA
jgi:hypothetical protein